MNQLRAANSELTYILDLADMKENLTRVLSLIRQQEKQVMETLDTIDEILDPDAVAPF